MFTSRRSRIQFAAIAALLLAVWIFVIPSKRIMNVAEPARSILANADSWTLYALDPGAKFPAPEGVPMFHGHEILGQAELADSSSRSELTYELNWGMLTSRLGAMCFNPRHGIRAETAEGTVDLSICFECFHVHIYQPGATKYESEGTTDDPAETFNRIFEGVGLRIAPTRH